MDAKEPLHLEEEKPLIEFPALIKIAIALFSFCIGLSLLFIPWYIALFLFLGMCLALTMFFDLYIAVLIFLVGAYLHPTALIPALQPLHVARNLAFVVLFIWLTHIIIYRDFRVIKSPQNIFVIGFTLFMLASCFQYFDYSFPDFLELTTKAVVLYFVIVNIVKNRKQILILIWMLILLGVISSTTGLFQYFQGVGLRLVGSVVRVFGTTENPNILAAELVLIVPILIALFTNYKSLVIKTVLFSFLTMIIIGIVLTFSRAGMAALLLVLALSAVQLLFRRKNRLAAIAYSFLIVLLLILVILPFIPKEYWERMQTITDPEEISIASRIDAWKLALNMMFEHPFVGVGYGIFKYEFLNQALTSSDIRTKFVMLHAHNLFLHTGAEDGIFALAFLTLIIFYSWRQLRNAKKSFSANNDLLFSGISGGLEISLIGFVAMNMVSWHLDLMIFWIIVGLSVVLNKISSEMVSLQESG